MRFLANLLGQFQKGEQDSSSADEGATAQPAQTGKRSAAEQGAGQKALNKAEEDTSLDRIEQVLEHLDSQEARNLAAMALLLGRVAHADEELLEDERRRMERILASEMQLDEEQAKAVTDLAVKKELCLALDRHLVLRHLKEAASHDQRLNLVRALFYLAAVEDINEQESEEIRLITRGLGLQHNDFIKLRSEFSEYRSLLKNLPDSA